MEAHGALAKVRDSWLCVRCRRAGYTTAAEVVHHIQPISEADEKKLDLANCESLCREHHESLHGRGPTKQQQEWTQYLSHQRNTI